MRDYEELFNPVSQSSPSYVILHGAFAPPTRQELMEVAALPAGKSDMDGYRSLVRCDIPDTPQDGENGSQPGVLEDDPRNAPSADEVFTHLHNAFALEPATVVMWGGMAYRFHVYAKEKQLKNHCFNTRVIDLQAAVVMHFDLKTSDCKDPRSVIRLLNLAPEADCWSRGSFPFVHAMNAVMQKLIEDGWTPESTPTAITNGCDIGEEAEAMRIDRWEQIRERQNNLGIERRPIPDVTPAFIVLDGEHVTLRSERFSRLIELALVVAYRKEREGHATYELGGRSLSSLIQLEHVENTPPHAWQITGIDPEAVRRAPPLPRVIGDMVAAAPWDRGVLVTWGPDDARVITHNCVQTGIPSPITDLPLIDLQRAFSRFYDLGPQQVGLQTAAAFLDIDTSRLDLHRAMADTLVTWHVLNRMLAAGWTPHWRPWHRRQAQVLDDSTSEAMAPS